MKEKVIPKSVWGPKAWHLLHAFSIHPSSEITTEEQHSYYLFYKTFYSTDISNFRLGFNGY